MTWGNDVSYAQGGYSDAEMLHWTAGGSFLIARTGYGATGVDDTYARWRKLFAGRGRGAYHFAYPNGGDGAKQGRRLVAMAGQVDVLALDMENLSGLTFPEADAWSCDFLAECIGHANETWFYTMGSWASNFPRVQRLLPDGLWVAHYNVAKPLIGRWKHYRCWQSGGRLGLDYNRLNGDWPGGAMFTPAQEKTLIAAAAQTGEIHAFMDGVRAFYAKEPDQPTRQFFHAGYESAATGGGAAAALAGTFSLSGSGNIASV
jgi:hypothetical protein